jgi:hypothetical protein
VHAGSLDDAGDVRGGARVEMIQLHDLEPTL